MKIEIKELQRLDLKIGEILLVYIPKNTDYKQMDQITRSLRDAFESAEIVNRFLVVREGEIRFEAIKPEPSHTQPPPNPPIRIRQPFVRSKRTEPETERLP